MDNSMSTSRLRDARYSASVILAYRVTARSGAGEVAEMMVRLMRLQEEVHEAWDLVPKEERAGLTYPGELGVGPRF